jgi:hypothetical protein
MELDLDMSDFNKDDYIEACLLSAIGNVEDISELIKEKKGEPCSQCRKGTKETCSYCGEPICDDDAVKSGDSGYGAGLSEETRCCPGECAKKEAGFDNV